MTNGDTGDRGEEKTKDECSDSSTIQLLITEGARRLGVTVVEGGWRGGGLKSESEGNFRFNTRDTECW